MHRLVPRTFDRKRKVSIKYRIVDSFKEGVSDVRVSLKRKECPTDYSVVLFTVYS